MFHYASTRRQFGIRLYILSQLAITPGIPCFLRPSKSCLMTWQQRCQPGSDLRSVKGERGKICVAAGCKRAQAVSAGLHLGCQGSHSHMGRQPAAAAPEMASNTPPSKHRGRRSPKAPKPNEHRPASPIPQTQRAPPPVAGPLRTPNLHPCAPTTPYLRLPTRPFHIG